MNMATTETGDDKKKGVNDGAEPNRKTVWCSVNIEK